MMRKDEVELLFILDELIKEDDISVDNPEVYVLMMESFLGSGFNLPWRPLKECVEEWYKKEWKQDYDE